MEIFSWNPAISVALPAKTSLQQNMPMNSTTVKERYIKLCGVDFPHYVGQVITDVVMTCLEFEDRTKALAEYEMQLFFQKEIVGRLAAAAGRI